jgi:hypothetical protein
LIGHGKLVALRPSRSKDQQFVLESVMPSRNEATRAYAARLQLEKTPISDDANLLKLQEQAATYLYEAKRRDASEPNELISTVVDAVARDYVRHAIRKQRRRA